MPAAASAGALPSNCRLPLADAGSVLIATFPLIVAPKPKQGGRAQKLGVPIRKNGTLRLKQSPAGIAILDGRVALGGDRVLSGRNLPE